MRRLGSELYVLEADATRGSKSLLAALELPAYASSIIMTTTTEPASTTECRGFAFWAIILALNLSSFLTLLEGTIISNALPAISTAFNSSGTLWIGSAYNLTAAAFMPAAGGLAQAFGRKPVFLTSLTIFLVGSTMSAVAKSIETLIAGRAIQGLGAAGVFTCCAIILADIVPLSNRGIFNGINQMTWCLASAAGPAIGGLFASKGIWRWIFYINLPLAAPAVVIIVGFLRLKTPQRKLSDALRQTDWIGSALVALSSISVSIALVCGGVQYAWDSWRVVFLFCLGVTGFVAFILYEVYLARFPLIPFQVLNDRTTLSGYAQIFIVPIPFLAVIYYMPLYFQACKGYSESKSGLALFGITVTTPVASAATGVLIKYTQRYRPQIWTGWLLVIIGLALLCTVHERTSEALVIFYESLAGVGFGVQFAALYFPVLAPLPLAASAPALAFFTFLRMFAQIWGINVGGAILQGKLDGTTAIKEVAAFKGKEVMQLIPLLDGLDDQQLDAVRHAFAEGLSTVWKVMVALVGLGFILSLFMRHVNLHTKVDSDWGLEQGEAKEKRETETSSSSRETV